MHQPISIHAPHEGERPGATDPIVLELVFQSTLPTRGSDRPQLSDQRHLEVISIHAPHEGERRAQDHAARHQLQISIHAPHEGERLHETFSLVGEDEISIHAPHEGERRVGAGGRRADPADFNPRSPRGGATLVAQQLRAHAVISIHAPHEGERPRLLVELPLNGHFNPRSPRGGATPSPCSRSGDITEFQSTLPTRGSDSCCAARAWTTVYFNPRSPRGGATRTAAR